MRLEEYITRKKNYVLETEIIFSDDSFIKEIKDTIKNYSKNKRDKLIKTIFKKHGFEKLHKYKGEIIDYINNEGMRNVDYGFDKDGLVIQIPKTKKILNHYYMKIGPNTKLEDVKEAFSTMKGYFSDKQNERNRKKIYLKRDLFVFNKAKEGMCWEDIRDLFRDSFHQTLSETLIRTIVTDVCNKIGMPKKDRPVIHTKKIKDKNLLKL